MATDQDKTKFKLTKEELLAGKCVPNDDLSTPRDPRFKSPDDLLLKLVAQKSPSLPKESNHVGNKENGLLLEPRIEKITTKESAYLSKADVESLPVSNEFPFHLDTSPKYQANSSAYSSAERDSRLISVQETTIEETKTPETTPEPEEGPSPEIEEINKTGMASSSPEQKHAFMASDGQWGKMVDPSAKNPTAELEELRERYYREMIQWMEFHQNIKLWQSQVMDIVQNLKKELNKSKNIQAELETLKEQMKAKDAEIMRLRKDPGNKAHKITDWLKGFQKTSS